MNLTIVDAATEARHHLGKLKPTWNVSVCVYRASSYSLGQSQHDDPRFDPLRVNLPATTPITEATLEDIRQQVAKAVVEREKIESRLHL